METSDNPKIKKNTKGSQQCQRNIDMFCFTTVVLCIITTHQQDKQLIRSIIWRLCDTFEMLYGENDRK